MTAFKKICGIGLLALLMMSGATLTARSQEASPGPAGSKQEVSQPQQPGPGQQLAHESREAAGEEKDETEEFKKSPSVEFVAKYVTGGNLQQAYWLSVLLNFAVIAIVIVWAGKKFMPGMFRARTAAIQKAMQEAQRASEEARRKLADIEARLEKLDVEIGAMRDAAAKEAASEEVRIQAATQEEAKKIVASAEQEIAAAAKAARRQLAAHAADLSVGLAQKQIHVDAATDQSLVRNFTNELAASARKDGN